MQVSPLYPAPFTNLNRDYIVKVSTPENSRGVAVGVSGLLRICGDYHARKYVNRALSSKSNKTICRHHSKYIITFYYR